MSHVNQGRRAFLEGGALVLAFALLPRAARAEFNGMGVPPVANPKLAGSLQRTPFLDAWIRVAPDGRVTVFSGKVELGTGVRTALAQVALEQLELQPDDIEFVQGDTARTPNEGFTAGSHTLADSGTALLHASAQVAALLRRGAAAQWRVDPETVMLQAGRVVGPDGRGMHYGAALRGLDAAGLHRMAADTSPLRAPARYRLIGKPLARVDIPAKVTGGAAYVQDMRLPGMVHGRVVRPPRPGARLARVDLDAVRRLPGVRRVVRDGSYLAVLADDEWRAVQAMNALAANAQWQGGAPLPQADAIHATLQQLPAQHITILDRGNVGQPAANKTLSDQRAKAVTAALVKQGIAATRLSAKGWGQEKPVADNRTEEGRAQNRRVDIILLRRQAASR